ncbi:FkbM family methyltransferase [Xanthobacter sp.]|uniref:FkbM family methyltransferase n=1 Tax=Xanthobacter sp. TaxID=35809 RepID=UPI0025E56548|nr:FkbM family methyltransferase [Xanthobacter sp.]
MDLSRKLHNSKAGLRAIMHFDNRWEVVATRLLFRGTGMITYRKNGMEFVIDHHGGDETGTRACLTSPMYRLLIPLMALKGPLTLVDIGSNGGGFPILLSDMGFALRKIVAVEMNPRVFARMQLNLVQNFDAELKLFNCAISGQAGTINADFGRGSTGESISGSLGHSSHGVRRHAAIEAITFDDLIGRSLSENEVVDLCKIDIEGSEYEIFASGNCSSLRRCRNLVIEIHAVAGKTPEQVVSAICDLGFAEIPRPEGGELDVYCFRNLQLT